MKTQTQVELVALDATELEQVQGGNTPPTGVWIGENGEGCIPGFPYPTRPNNNPLAATLGSSWSV